MNFFFGFRPDERRSSGADRHDLELRLWPRRFRPSNQPDGRAYEGGPQQNIRAIMHGAGKDRVDEIGARRDLRRHLVRGLDGIRRGLMEGLVQRNRDVLSNLRMPDGLGDLIDLTRR